MDVRRSFPLQKASTLRTVCLNLAVLFFFLFFSFFFVCQCAFFRTFFHAHKIKGCDLHSGFRVSLQTGISRSDREKIHGVLVASLSARQIQRLFCVVFREGDGLSCRLMLHPYHSHAFRITWAFGVIYEKQVLTFQSRGFQTFMLLMQLF